MSASWCATCHTRHGVGERCPGELLATGPERRGWRVEVQTPIGPETYGVLVAEADPHWRARILTYPRMLWCVPGGRATMKFVASTAGAAERAAEEFVRAHCRQRGLRILQEFPHVNSEPVDPERASSGAPSRGREPRHLRRLAVRLHLEGGEWPAMTADLSRGGLFLVSSQLLPQGSPIELDVVIEGRPVRVGGKVAWVRRRDPAGRPTGMGVELFRPPAAYLRYVESLERLGRTSPRG